MAKPIIRADPNKLNGTTQIDWTVDTSSAQDNGTSGEKIQTCVTGTIGSLKAKILVGSSWVVTSVHRVKIKTTSHTITVENDSGEFKWILDTDVLSADATRSKSGLPSEFFGTLAEDLKAVVQSGGAEVIAKSAVIQRLDDC